MNKYRQQARELIDSRHEQVYGIASHLGRSLEDIADKGWFERLVADLIEQAGGLD